LRAAIDELTDQDWERPSGCTGWLVRDLAGGDIRLVLG
jgi:hypothetical protein